MLILKTKQWLSYWFTKSRYHTSWPSAREK